MELWDHESSAWYLEGLSRSLESLVVECLCIHGSLPRDGNSSGYSGKKCPPMLLSSQQILGNISSP